MDSGWRKSIPAKGTDNGLEIRTLRHPDGVRVEGMIWEDAGAGVWEFKVSVVFPNCQPVYITSDVCRDADEARAWADRPLNWFKLAWSTEVPDERRAGWTPAPDTVTPLDQPPPVAAEGDVWATVIPRLPPILRPHAEERRRVGIARYNTPLQAHNGRDAMVDMLAEALDGIAYAQQAVMERPGNARRETLLWMAIDFAKKVAETIHDKE